MSRPDANAAGSTEGVEQEASLAAESEARRPNLERIAEQYTTALETDEVPWPPMSGSYASRAHEVFYAVPSLLAYIAKAEQTASQLKKQRDLVEDACGRADALAAARLERMRQLEQERADAHARWKIVADALAGTERDLEDQRTKRRAAEAQMRDLREALENVLVNVEPFLKRDTPGFYNSPSWDAIGARARRALQATQEDQ